MSVNRSITQLSHASHESSLKKLPTLVSHMSATPISQQPPPEATQSGPVPINFDYSKEVSPMNLFNQLAYMSPEDQPLPASNHNDSELATVLSRAGKRVRVFRELYCKRKPFYLEQNKTYASIR